MTLLPFGPHVSLVVNTCLSLQSFITHQWFNDHLDRLLVCEDASDQREQGCVHSRSCPCWLPTEITSWLVPQGTLAVT